MVQVFWWWGRGVGWWWWGDDEEERVLWTKRMLEPWRVNGPRWQIHKCFLFKGRSFYENLSSFLIKSYKSRPETASLPWQDVSFSFISHCTVTYDLRICINQAVESYHTHSVMMDRIISQDLCRMYVSERVCIEMKGFCSGGDKGRLVLWVAKEPPQPGSGEGDELCDLRYRLYQLWLGASPYSLTAPLPGQNSNKLSCEINKLDRERYVSMAACWYVCRLGSCLWQDAGEMVGQIEEM